MAETLEAVRNSTPTGRLVTTADVVGATVFLLENRSEIGRASVSTADGC